LAKSKKLWGGRFAEKTAKSAEKFTSSVAVDQRLYRYDIAGSIAHAKMLGRQRIISRREADRIVRGLKAIERDIERNRIRFSAADEDIHMGIERRLIERIGRVGEKLHTARSRNDQVALDLRLYLREELIAIMAAVEGLKLDLARSAKRHLSVVMPGYTHLQRAQPILLSHHLLAYADMLERDHERFAGCRERTDVLPLGSGALAGTTFPIDRPFVARQLKFARISSNSVDAVSDRDFLLEFVAAAAVLFVHLSRLAEEMILWSTTEFGFIELPDRYCTGSSMMPQKKNPDVAELIRGKSGRVFGHLMALLTVMKGLPLAYNRDLQEDKVPLFDTVDTTRESLGVMRELVREMKIDRRRLASAASDGFLNATELADYLVRKDLSFRSAHALVGAVVRYCLAKPCRIEELSLEELRRFSTKIGEDVYDCLTLEAAVNRRRAQGGTSAANVRRRLRELGVL
jgi:argininosuccinate lyase